MDDLDLIKQIGVGDKRGMLDVWRSTAKFAGRSGVKTWLFSIARNKLVDDLS